MLKKCLCVVVATFIATLSLSAQSKSQCSGLSNSSCSSNNTCTWRKASTDKNGKKTKAHCRALPGKAKPVSSSKKANLKKAKDSVSKKSPSKSTSSAKAATTKSKKKTTDSKSKASKAKSKTKKSTKKTAKSKTPKKSKT